MGDKKISATSVFFESKAYETNEDSLIDYDQLEKDAEEFKPNLIIAGYSAYPRDLDYKRFREICDKVGAYLMVDMAHYNGLVVGGILANPFEYADVVTTTTHKMMRGPRGGLIFSKVEISDKINFAVFPQCQGGPHMNQIAGVACQMKEMASEEYKEYAKQVVANAKALAQGLLDKGFTLVTGGTDNHLMLWNCKPAGLTGAKVDLVLEQMHIFSNKNSIKGDKSAAIAPGAVRLGTPAVTTRGMKEDDMKTIADFCEKAHSRALEIQEKAGSKKIADFKDVLKNEDFTEIQNEIHAFAEKFEMPGEVKF